MQLVSCRGELYITRNLSEMPINVSEKSKDTLSGRWPWMESRKLLKVTAMQGLKKNKKCSEIRCTQTLHLPARLNAQSILKIKLKQILNTSLIKNKQKIK